MIVRCPSCSDAPQPIAFDCPTCHGKGYQPLEL